MKTKLLVLAGAALWFLGSATAWTQEPPADASGTATESQSEATPPGTSEEPETSGSTAEPSPVATIPVESQPTEAPETPGATKLDDIVVTANKRNQLLSEVGGSVSAMSGSKLKSIGATNFQDLATYLPGISSASAGIGQNEIVVRGVAAGVEGQSVSSTVGVYLDEMPVGSSTAYAFGVYAMDVSPFDLDRVELLSGPQGTLYGAMSLGGLLKYVTQPPNVGLLTAAIQGDVSNTLEGGANNGFRGMLNAPAKVPFTEIPLALRANYFHDKNAGLIDDPGRGVENVDESTNNGGRASLLTQITPDLTLRLTGLQQDIDRGGTSQADYDGATQKPVNGQYEQSTHFEEPFYSKLRQYSGVATWTGDWGDLTSASGWASTKLGLISDQTPAFGAQFGTGDSTPYKLFVGADLDKFTQEVRFGRPGTWLDWQVGGFYTHESAIAYVDLWAESDPPNHMLDVDLYTHYREKALFANTTFHILDNLDLGLGGRHATNEQTYQQFTGGTLGTAPADTSVHHGGDKSNTYLINPVYRLNDSVMLYARAASGYRPGGPNYIVPPPNQQTNPTFDPDTVWNYELGSKMSLGSNVSLNLSAFRIDWDKIQLLVFQNNFNTILNGRSAQVNGAEASTVYLVAPGWTVAGNATYTRAELSEDSPELEAHKGDPLPLSPKVGAALASDYRMPLWEGWNATLGASFRHIGKRPSGFDGSTVQIQYWVPAYNTLDLRAGIQWNSLDLGLIVKNALDTVGQISADTRGHGQDANAPVRIALLPPRTAQLTLTYYY